MKNKIIGIILCVALLITGFTATIFVRQEPGRVHQHLTAAEKAACTNHDSGEFCTHLPLVQIETDEDIPGKPVYSKKKHTHERTTAADGSDRIVSTVKITDHDETNNHLGDEPTLESLATIHVHGNSSRYFDKLGYKLKLIDDKGNSNNQSVMGMAAHSEWVLHGPYLDKTLIRNYMWYNIGGEIMSYAPNVRFCELFINGEYEGVYVMTETITAGEDGARLQLSVNKKDNTYSGYLLRMDRTSDVDINNFTKYVYRLNQTSGINIEYPGPKNLTPELSTSITKDFSEFEKSLYSYDFDSDEFGYKKTIDFNSFVDYFIINEFTLNYDAGGYSTYIYKDQNGRFRMCIWDFNNSCDNYQEQSIPIDDFRLINAPWYWMLVKNEDFTKRIIERYHDLRTSVLSDDYLDEYIDDTIAYLGDAIDRNFERWGYTFEDDELLTPEDRNLHSYDEAVTQLKSFVKRRAEFLDTNIDVLAQYCAESRVKKFIENAN
ncbi:MAG: CotH kinase family protein [Ruminococcus sp.]|nr:CotH kinase family protein [Ruminococcus sp.]